MLPSIAGCSEILGFAGAAPNGSCADSRDCAPDESCVGGACAPLCRDSDDCANGKSCISPSSGVPLVCLVRPEAGAEADAAAEADAGAGPDADAEADSNATCRPGFADCNVDAADGCETDLTSDPSNCSVCGRMCPTGVCTTSTCRSPQYVGYSSQGTMFASFQANVLAAWHLPPVPPGVWLWKIGILVSSATPGVRANLGVYADNGAGFPGPLVASGSFISGSGASGASGNTNEVTIAEPLPLLQGGIPYYVAIVVDATDAGTGLVLPTNAGAQVPWFETNYSFQSLPKQAQLPQTIMNPQPDVYIVVAQ
jgi:hypothetical protein